MITDINVERNNERIEEFNSDRQYKKDMYMKCDNVCLIIEDMLEVVNNPIDKIKLNLYLKKVRHMQKKYYVPSNVELMMSRRKFY